MIYIHPDFMEAINHVSSSADAPSTPEFQVVKHLIGYLYICPHRLIMYPSGFGRNITHELYKEVSIGYFHSQNISNGLAAFASGGEFHA